jgi:CRP-like cAMP-binding protein/rhodanese-related sulfurtransferase
MACQRTGGPGVVYIYSDEFPGVIEEMDAEQLKNLIPFNTLTPENLARLAKRLKVEKFPAGQQICKQGDTDPTSIYLLSGQVALTASSTTMRRYIKADSNEAHSPIADAPPRLYTITADTDVEIVTVGNYELDRAVMLDEVSTTITSIETGGARAMAADTAWLAKVMGWDAFARLSADRVAAVILKLESQPVKAKDVVIRQGDAGDYYYVVREGRFNVVRKGADGKVVVLNELKPGSVFGEESLISGEARNASVVAMEDGVLMRLSRADFDRLLKQPLVNFVSVDEAGALFKGGASIIDVRVPAEFKQGSLRGSVNIPVDDLRERLKDLPKDVRYITCCRTGNLSQVAAFLMRQRGYDAVVLKGGLQAVARKSA